MTTLQDDLTRADDIAAAAHVAASSRPATRRCAIYLRVSLDHTGEALAVERQREDAISLARHRGWTVVGEYADNSISASKRNVRRPSYDRMVSDYAAGLFDAVVCYDLDRLTRQPRQLEDWIDAAESRGLALVTANGEADLTTDAGRLFARIKAAVARSEVERKGARQSRANRQRAERGGVPKGARPHGYTTDGEIVPEEAERVRALFDGFSKGDSLRSLSQRFGLTPSTVHGMLVNPRYAGRRVYLGSVVADGDTVRWPAIVTPELFDVVAARITDPRRKSNLSGSTARKHLLSGVARCECGDPRPVVSGGTGDRYRCRACGMSRTREAVDAFVVATLLARLSQPDALEAMRPQPADVSELLADAAQIKATLARLAVLVADGVLDDDAVRAAAEPLRARLEDTQRRIAASTTPAILSSLDGVEGRLSEVWAELPTDRRRALIAAFCDVVLHRQTRARGFRPESVAIAWRSA